MPDDQEQVQASTPLDPDAVSQQAASMFGIIAATLNGLTQTVGRIDEKTDRQGERIDELVSTTNHRLDDFRADRDSHRTELAQAMLAHQQIVSAAVAQKADRSEIGTGIIWREIKTSRTLQGALGVLVVVLSPVVIENWRMLMESIRGLI